MHIPRAPRPGGSRACEASGPAVSIPPPPPAPGVQTLGRAGLVEAGEIWAVASAAGDPPSCPTRLRRWRAVLVGPGW